MPLMSKDEFSIYRESKVWYQGIVSTTVSGVFQDLKLKILQGSD